MKPASSRNAWIRGQNGGAGERREKGGRTGGGVKVQGKITNAVKKKSHALGKKC